MVRLDSSQLTVKMMKEIKESSTPTIQAFHNEVFILSIGGRYTPPQFATREDQNIEIAKSRLLRKILFISISIRTSKINLQHPFRKIPSN